MSKKQKPFIDYAISAISQDDFVDLVGGSLEKGTSFTVGDLDALCMTITDDDKHLDTSKRHPHQNDANQTADVDGVGDVGGIEGGKLIKLKSSTGEKYEMVQLVTETGGTFWTFVGDIPDSDETLSIRHVFDHKKAKYKDGLGVKYVVAGDDVLTTDEDTPTTGNLLLNDCIGFSASHDDDDDDDGGIDGNDFRVVAIEGGEIGTTFTVVSARGNEALVTVSADGTVTVDPSGKFDSLAVGETDTITLDYTVGATRIEGKGKKATEVLETDKGELTIVIEGLNDAPVAVADSYAATGSTVIDAANGVLANDIDIDGDTLTASVVSGPANGTLTLNADGSFTYVPTSLFSGDVEFTYSAADPFGASSTATATISVAAAAPPLADSYTVDEDNPLAVGADAGVLANDPVNAGDTLTAAVVAGPDHGSLVLNADGSFTYLPDADFNGADAFIYSVTDSAGETRDSVAEITVDPVNDAPVYDLSTFRQLDVAGEFSIGETIARLQAFDVDGDPRIFRIDGPDAFLFELSDTVISATTSEVELIGRGTFPNGDPLFPHGNESVLELAGEPDFKFDVTLFVSDGFDETSVDISLFAIAAA